MATLAEDIARIRTKPADSALEFFAFTLTADEDGQIYLDSQTIWTGFADDENRIELRQARRVSLKMAEHWESIGTPGVFITELDDLVLFYLLGGHALIERAVAEKAVPDWLEPQPCYQEGFSGFLDSRSVDQTAFRRAPTPRLRMNVLTRDKRRCRICGRNPDDNVDLVLNVHHIRPWGQRGLTIPNNLITLCHTCHAGLDPHFDPSLYGYLDRQRGTPYAERFKKAVQNYREVAYSAIASTDLRAQ